jgi:lauroyl/myristoyl acyltransferase
VLVAPLDRIDRRGEGVTASVFGQPVCFPPWAVRIAGRRGLPILPVYVRLEAGAARVQIGDPVHSDDPDVALRETVGQFERWSLERPGSWAFLGDKRWQRVLRQSRSA